MSGNAVLRNNSKVPSTVISLIVFDGDDTLWYGLDGAYISGLDYWDDGRQDFTFQKIDMWTIQRNDGRRFRLFPEVLNLLDSLKKREILISMASYNHRAPVINALQAFQIQEFFFHPIVEWHSQKDKMLKAILREGLKQGFLVSPETTLFIDDDMKGVYRSQMKSCGIHFLQRGVDIHNLSDLLDHPRYKLVPIQTSLI